MSIAHKLVPAGIVAAVIAGVAYTVVTSKGPCEVAIPYRVGTVDPRFGVTSAEFRDASVKAAAVWDNATHHKLFAYDPKAALTINLVYDWRQSATQSGLSEVDRIKALQASLDKVDADMLPRRAAFEKSSKAFSRDLDRHNARIDNWNHQRGSIYETREAIMAEQRTLQQRERVLARERERVNALVSRHNTLVKEMNGRIEALKRNALNGIFEKGFYSRRGGTARIDIYQFEKIADLVLTLAHEFGHALGLPHGSDPHSLMSPYLLSQKLVLSAEDLRMLKAYCSS